MSASWPKARDGLLTALERRRDERLASLEGRLAKRQQDEEQRVTTNLDRFAATLRTALASADKPGSPYTQLALDLDGSGRDGQREASLREAAQLRADRTGWQTRLERLPAEREAELARIRRRYADVTPHLFPVAVVFLIPRREATR